MEESLRNYFLDLGYFVVRGIKFTYQGFDVTDIDLWLYKRPSSLTRERINVDIKNKRTPQAIERIFWAKGLQEALGLDKSLVATTDKRPVVRDFGRLNNVSVLDGNFLSLLSHQYDTSLNSTRFVEEEFVELLSFDRLDKLTGDWKGRLEKAKSRLLSQLDYGGCNAWLKDIAYFVEQAITNAQNRQIACRLIYLEISFFLVGLDYVLKDVSFMDNEMRYQNLREGFMHGTLGRTGTDKVLNTAVQLIENYLNEGRQLALLLRKHIEEAYEQIPADILKEYFGRSSISKNLFSDAQQFETLAYTRSFMSPLEIKPELQGTIGVLLDFFELERRQFFDSFRK